VYCAKPAPDQVCYDTYLQHVLNRRSVAPGAPAFQTPIYPRVHAPEGNARRRVRANHMMHAMGMSIGKMAAWNVLVDGGQTVPVASASLARLHV